MGTPDPHDVVTMEARFAQITQQWPRLAWLQHRLEAAGLTPTSVRELRGNARRSSWVVQARPSEPLRQHFELAPEVLLLVTPWDETHARDVARLEEVFASEMRVDPGLAIVVAHDPRADAQLRAVLPEKRAYVFVHDDELGAVTDPQAWLRARLRETLGARRLFDHRLPAAGPQFFGRQKEFEALSRDLSLGHCVGVFGLRKVGKTSLLRRTAEKLREGGVEKGRALVVEVDLLKTPFARRDLAGVAGLIGSQLDHCLAQDGALPRPPHGDPFARLEATVVAVERDFAARTMLFLDEYELLLDGRLPTRDGVELLSWLRGLAQSHPRGFGFVLAGRNARLIASARIEGVDNPMYRFLRDFPLAGLSPEDCRAMLRKIGGRLGLQFTPEALQRIVEETGGHPALARTFGDLVDQSVPTAARLPARVDAAAVQRVAPRFAREVEQDMRELVDAAKDVDPRAEDHLAHLAFGVPWLGGAVEARIDDALARYGILHDAPVGFRIRHLRDWLRENYACPTVAAHG